VNVSSFGRTGTRLDHFAAVPQVFLERSLTKKLSTVIFLLICFSPNPTTLLYFQQHRGNVSVAQKQTQHQHIRTVFVRIWKGRGVGTSSPTFSFRPALQFAIRIPALYFHISLSLYWFSFVLPSSHHPQSFSFVRVISVGVPILLMQKWPIIQSYFPDSATLFWPLLRPQVRSSPFLHRSIAFVLSENNISLQHIVCFHARYVCLTFKSLEN
jgi:hypothetical protein